MFIWLVKLHDGEGNGTPLQYSCLENPMDRGAWKAVVHRVTESQTRLSDFTFLSLFFPTCYNPWALYTFPSVCVIFSFFHQYISLSKILLPPRLDLFQGIVLEVETPEYSNLPSKVFLAVDSFSFYHFEYTMPVPSGFQGFCRKVSW